ncbi:hypothetical protein CJ199_09755 [Brevibacterium paucivorans]|uniref:Uncharacterized protein n=1 Tax=Brevibacterium paucivorans TaxID=170994 RepID=A0A2N6VKG6_9MICO|nr:hypothetical protein [Brevibacterium sp. ACRRH]PMD04651.1 hypothetical protein CJ199_09755 [Brevibacterium paucivorans]
MDFLATSAKAVTTGTGRTPPNTDQSLVLMVRSRPCQLDSQAFEIGEWNRRIPAGVLSYAGDS